MDISGFKPVSERPEYVKALIYGTMGAGKTRFCADAPEPIWFDSESSTETLRNAGFGHIPVKTPRDPSEILKDVKQAIKAPDVKTIVIDSISSCLDHYLRQRMREVGRGEHGRARDQFEIYESDYKYATQVFLDLFDVLQDAPINVIFIGHERYIMEGEPPKLVKIVPEVTPKLRKGLTQLVNVVAYMEVEPSGLKGAVRKLHLNPSRLIEAKNRLNIQEQFITNPTWKDVFKNGV